MVQSRERERGNWMSWEEVGVQIRRGGERGEEVDAEAEVL